MKYRFGCIVAILVLAVSCGRTELDARAFGSGGVISTGGVAFGSGGVISTGGVATGAGGRPASGGTVGTGGASSAAHHDASTGRACNWPSCLANVGTDCLPAGACIQQGSYSDGKVNICYANGVKEIIGLDGSSSFNATVTVKTAATTCFTMRGSILPLILGGGRQVTMSLEDAAGKVIGTIVADPTINQLIVTCTGSQPVALDPLCIAGLSVSTGCTSGTCLP
jgi:hypothetical protein